MYDCQRGEFVMPVLLPEMLIKHGSSSSPYTSRARLPLLSTELAGIEKHCLTRMRGLRSWHVHWHDHILPPLTFNQFWYLCELLYVISNCLLKFSIGYFYLRVAAQRWHIWCIRLLMLGTILFGLIYFFLVMLQCLPSKYIPIVLESR